MLRFLLVITAASALAASAVQAADVNHNAMKGHGFAEISELMKDMTPEQRREVMKLAAERQKELENMSPAERRALEKQLKSVSGQIEADVGYDKIDPAKVDTGLAQDTKATMGTMKEYQER